MEQQHLLNRPKPDFNAYKRILDYDEDDVLPAILAGQIATRDLELPPTIGKLKVSIIMPTYRRDHTIHQTIEAIIAQTYSNWELIVIDNEPDHQYFFHDNRIRYYSHTLQQSAAYARNQGIQYITGELVFFLDDDDIIEPGYLQWMVAPFEQNPDVQVTSCLIKLVEGIVANHNEYCTPTLIVRKEHVQPVWRKSSAHDKEFFGPIVNSLPQGAYVQIDKVLVCSYTSPHGGIRAGSF